MSGDIWKQSIAIIIRLNIYNTKVFFNQHLVWLFSHWNYGIILL